MTVSSRAACVAGAVIYMRASQRDHEDISKAIVRRVWVPEKRLSPWILYDLERSASAVETLAQELTADERKLVRESARRMLIALSTHQLAGIR